MGRPFAGEDMAYWTFSNGSERPEYQKERLRVKKSCWTMSAVDLLFLTNLKDIQFVASYRISEARAGSGWASILKLK